MLIWVLKLKHRLCLYSKLGISIIPSSKSVLNFISFFLGGGLLYSVSFPLKAVLQEVFSVTGVQFSHQGYVDNQLATVSNFSPSSS